MHWWKLLELCWNSSKFLCIFVGILLEFFKFVDGNCWNFVAILGHSSVSVSVSVQLIVIFAIIVSVPPLRPSLVSFVS